MCRQIWFTFTTERLELAQHAAPGNALSVRTIPDTTEDGHITGEVFQHGEHLT